MHLVRGITCYVGPEVKGKLQVGRCLDVNKDGSLCQAFKNCLLKGRPQFRLTMEIRTLRPLVCQFGRAGETAGIAAWIDGPAMLGVTTYLAGVDPTEECAAVAMMLAKKRFPIPLYRWHDVLEAKPPIYGSFMFTREGYGDDRVATAAPALANSFFSLLGAVEEGEPGDHP